MKTIIGVTGASGHIGNVVCRTLIREGFHVKALYHSFDKSLEGLPVERYQGSVLNPSDLESFIEGCEIVINCAAIIDIHGTDSKKTYNTNTKGPENVIRAAILKGVRKVIHLSSVHAVHELPLTEPFNELRPYKNANDYLYDYSKAMGEQIVMNIAKQSPVELVILRPSAIIGPFDFKPSEMGKALIDLYNQKIPALPEGGYDFVDVRDIANSILQAIQFGKNGEVYLLSGTYYSLKELAMKIHQITGKKMPSLTLPYHFLKLVLPLISLYSKLTGAAPLFTKASIDALKFGHPKMDASKAQRDLKHTSRTIETSLNDFYNWQKEQNVIH